MMRAGCRILLHGIAAVLLVTLTAPRATAQVTLPAQLKNDTVARAMVDEMNRARQLSLMSGSPLYHLNYTFAKGQSYLVSASLGALQRRVENQMRVPTVKARVGSYDYDDTNFVASGIYQGTRYDASRFPLDDNYLAMRRNWWLLTDMEYKGSAQSINLKRASQQNMQTTQDLPDFTKVEPKVLLVPGTPPVFEKDRWEKTVRSASTVFREYPDILESEVQFGFSSGYEYIITSEGTVVKRPFGIGFFRIAASALSRENGPLWDGEEVLGLSEKDFPAEEELRQRVKRIAERLTESLRAPKGESYIGPMLFEGEAAAQLVAQLVGRQLWVPRKPVMIPNRPVAWPRVELDGRMGAEVVSSLLTVRDDPTMETWQGTTLIGQTEVDLEGVHPQPLTMIESGRLKELFRTRTPSAAGELTNGRARIGGIFGANRGAATNLIVEAKETVPEASLKERLLARVKEVGKPYGIVVRRLDFPTVASNDAIRKLVNAASANSGKVKVSIPVAAYRVYPDGREERIRDMDFRELGLRALRDVLAAGDRQHLFQYLENAQIFARMGAGSYVAETSVISPSLLLEEVELEPVSVELPVAPLVEPPALSSLRQ